MRPARASSSTSITRWAYSRSTSPRSMPILRSAAATSTCAAARERAFCTCIRVTSTDRCRRSTPDGSPSAIRSPMQRPDPPEFAPGGDAFFESTPPILPLYQARAGQVFTLRHRRRAPARLFAAHSCSAWWRCSQERGIRAEGGTPDRGAFAVIRDAACRRRWRPCCRSAASARRCARTLPASVPGCADHRRRARRRGADHRRRASRSQHLSSPLAGDGRHQRQHRCDQHGGGEQTRRRSRAAA